MGIRSQGYVIVHVQAQRLHVALRSVFLAFVSEFFGAFAQVSIIDTAESLFPYGRQLLQFARGQSIYKGCGYEVHLIVVGQGVAVERTRLRHGFLRYDTVVLHAVNHVVETSSLRERNIAVCTDGLGCTVFHGFMYDEHFAKVMFAFSHAEQFGFEERQCAEAPARTALILVLDRGDRVFFHRGKDETGVGFFHVFLSRYAK